MIAERCCGRGGQGFQCTASSQKVDNNNNYDAAKMTKITITKTYLLFTNIHIRHKPTIPITIAMKITNTMIEILLSLQFQYLYDSVFFARPVLNFLHLPFEFDMWITSSASSSQLLGRDDVCSLGLKLQCPQSLYC